MQEKQVIQGEEKQDDTTNRITDKSVEDESEKAETVEKMEKVPVSDSEKIPEESKVSERTTEKSEQSAKIHPENTEKKQRKKKDRKEDSDSASKIEQITEKR